MAVGRERAVIGGVARRGGILNETRDAMGPTGRSDLPGWARGFSRVRAPVPCAGAPERDCCFSAAGTVWIVPQYWHRHTPPANASSIWRTFLQLVHVREIMEIADFGFRIAD